LYGEKIHVGFVMIEDEVSKALLEMEMTIAVAESCTGGLLAHRLTSSPGSSAYFRCGLVTYSNEAKMQFLGVDGANLELYGAVSEQTVTTMAEGVRMVCGTNLGLAVTGIAGPDGGSEEKPVGLIFVGLAIEGQETQWRKHQFSGDRLDNMNDFSDAALELLKEYLDS